MPKTKAGWELDDKNADEMFTVFDAENQPADDKDAETATPTKDEKKESNA